MTEHDEASTAVILTGIVITASIGVAIGVAIAAFGGWVWTSSDFSLFEKTLLTVLVVDFTVNATTR